MNSISTSERKKSRAFWVSIALLNLFICVSVVFFCFFTLELKYSTLYVIVGAILVSFLLFGFARTLGSNRIVSLNVLGWVIIFLISTHVTLGDRQGLWAGFRFDETLGWYPVAMMDRRILESGTTHAYEVSTDEFGHRNTNAYPESGRIPILLQGDSNAFGFGLDHSETLCVRIQKVIERDCFNFGVPGYDVNHFYFQYKEIEEQYDVVNRVILFNAGNDFSLSALKTPYLMPRPAIWVNETGLDEEFIPDTVFRKQVYGHQFLPPFSRYDDGMKTVIVGRDWGKWMPDSARHFRLPLFLFELIYPRAMNLGLRYFDPDALSAGKAIAPYYGEWQRRPVEAWPAPFRSYIPSFRRLIDLISQQKSEKTIIVVFPDKSSVTDTHVDRLILHDIVYRAAIDVGIEFIDVSDAFFSHHEPLDLYQEDFHLSAAGMELVAGMTRRHLLRQEAARGAKAAN